jgi:hypothetical protein
MDETSPISPLEPPAHDAFDPREDAVRHRRAKSLRRLKRLLVFGCALFTLTVWLFIRLEMPPGYFSLMPGPARVVRQHLEALNRGQFREAYQLFSPNYQREVSFELYRQLVVTHAAMFHTRLISVRSPLSSANRVVLEARLLSSDGERYLARFTLVRAGDRWWIDDLRWGADPGRRHIIAT